MKMNKAANMEMLPLPLFMHNTILMKMAIQDESEGSKIYAKRRLIQLIQEDIGPVVSHNDAESILDMNIELFVKLRDSYDNDDDEMVKDYFDWYEDWIRRMNANPLLINIIGDEDEHE